MLNKNIDLDFAKEVLKLQDIMMSRALSYTGNDSQAYDLLQETNYRAFLNQSRFKENTNLSGWVSIIMKNAFINSYRRKKMFVKYFNTDSQQYNAICLKNDPDNVLMTKDLWFRIHNLEERIRIPFEMHIKGYKYKEISENLSIPMGTVKSRIYQARETLSKIIES